MSENIVMDGWEDDEYKAFVEKFKKKKTTDDCYTPPNIYDAIADWVAREYGLSRADFVRPFFPGGDYQRFDYPPGAVVVDNPPFSILAEIVAHYRDTGRRFFLFAPTLTLFFFLLLAPRCHAVCRSPTRTRRKSTPAFSRTWSRRTCRFEPCRSSTRSSSARTTGTSRLRPKNCRSTSTRTRC